MQVSVSRGESFLLRDNSRDDGWLLVRSRATGFTGWAPGNYLSIDKKKPFRNQHH